jgi:preprotein translocase subunit YajC
MNSLVLAVSQSSANTAEWAASLLAFIVAGAGVWRFAIKQGRRQAEEAVEQAALKKIVDADLVNSVSGLSSQMAQVTATVRDVKRDVANLRRASRPNGKDSIEIGDQVALLRDDVHDIAGKLDAHAEKLDAHLKQVDEGGK